MKTKTIEEIRAFNGMRTKRKILYIKNREDNQDNESFMIRLKRALAIKWFWEDQPECNKIFGKGRFFYSLIYNWRNYICWVFWGYFVNSKRVLKNLEYLHLVEQENKKKVNEFIQEMMKERKNKKMKKYIPKTKEQLKAEEELLLRQALL